METLQENSFGAIRLNHQSTDCAIIRIDHKIVKASISLYGGQVLSWQPVGQEEVFWLSKTSEFKAGKAIRGGVPICWPWFGSFRTAGNHGFARQSNWHFSTACIAENNVTLELALSDDSCHEHWPYAFSLKQVLTFGETFSQKLIIENTSAKGVEFSGALHSYFHVSNPMNVTVPHLNGYLFDDKILQGVGQKDNLVDCQGPIDRIYHTSNVQQVVDRGFQRVIEVESDGCAQWVLWNPGKVVAEQMADIHTGGYLEYVCLEAANTNWVEIPAGQTKVMSQTVRLKSLFA